MHSLKSNDIFAAYNLKKDIITVMNIDNLLKKMDRAAVMDKRELFHQGAQKIKTSESVGTLNSHQDYTEHSFVQDGPKVTPRQTPTPKYKLDEELSKIEKMKYLYESRQKHSRTNKSLDRSSAHSGGNKSQEKHTLKPSNTPFFNKINKISHGSKDKTKWHESSCKNIYMEGLLENSPNQQESQQNMGAVTQERKGYEDLCHYPEEEDDSHR